MPTPPTTALTLPQPQPPVLPLTLVSDVIYTGYRLAGILPNAGMGENPEELAEGLNVLNAMLDDWNNKRLWTYTITRYLFNFVSGQQAYQLGPGASDWNFPRVPRLETASVVITLSPSNPVEQPMSPVTYQQWQLIPLKSTTSPIPYLFYYDAQFPIANVYFYPVPVSNQGSLNQVALYVWEQFSAFTATTQQVSFPPGYLKAIQYNLALEFAVRFPERAKLSPMTTQMAAQSIRDIKSQNAPTLDMRCDPAACPGQYGIYDWLSDRPRYR